MKLISKRVYDILIIGNGNEAYATASIANRRGLKTALVCGSGASDGLAELDFIAAKAFVNTTTKQYLETGNRNQNLSFEKFRYACEEAMKSVNIWLHSHDSKVEEAQGIDCFKDSFAKFVDDHTMQVNDLLLKADKILICNDLQNDSTIESSNQNREVTSLSEFWRMDFFPESVALIGNSKHSIELGQAMTRYGCQVILFDLQKTLESKLDTNLLSMLSEIFKSNRMEITSAAGEPTVNVDESGFIISTNGKKYRTDYLYTLLVPSFEISSLGMDKLDVKTSTNRIAVNNSFQTSKNWIYFSGPSMSLDNDSMESSARSMQAIRSILSEGEINSSLQNFPWTLKCIPAIARVGYSEAEAVRQFGRKNISVFSMDPDLSRFKANPMDSGYLKVIFNINDQVLGAEAVGNYAEQWIQLISQVITSGVPAEHVAGTIFEYPEYDETVRNIFKDYLSKK